MEEGIVPFRRCPAAVVDGGGVPSVRINEGVAGDGDDGVDLHLQYQSHVFKIFCRKVCDMERSAEFFHGESPKRRNPETI